MAKRMKKEDPKQEVIKQLLQMYEINSCEDIENALKDLLSSTIKNVLEAELDEHLGYKKSERLGESSNFRNGYKTKKIRSKFGDIKLEVPQDRDSSFEPRIVKKRSKDISSIEQKIINMYAKGMSTRQISETMRDINGFDVSKDFVSNVTDKILPQIEEWQNRPLSEVYPIILIDAIHYSVKEDNEIRKLAAYIVLGINNDGRKEVLTIEIGSNESAKHWLGVLNELKKRGVKDIFILCADGLTGIKEAINAVYPETLYQRCIIHQIRNTLKYVSDKDKKELTTDLKRIYQAKDEEEGKANLYEVMDKWQDKYPRALKSWEQNWDVLSPIFNFSDGIRKLIYTTNAIESLNASYRRLNRQRSVFPNKTSLLKALYLATELVTKKWTMPIVHWGKIYNELAIMFEERLP